MDIFMMIVGIMEYEIAIKKLTNLGEAIIKPSVDSNSGKNVRLLNIRNGIDIISNKTIEDIYHMIRYIDKDPDYLKIGVSTLIRYKLQQEYGIKIATPNSN